ncbi:hypothetical protein NDU88_003976 [Pleurodeles waltl]|uniref:Uncharacterized protein n=1 Tax=Pleurodeles waltl TaxID=8319 RepID=A0AAV7WSQ9_PLEWA|nr:hypothetical protein NDU88_003976 [Pleurodeles waltl]
MVIGLPGSTPRAGLTTECPGGTLERCDRRSTYANPDLEGSEVVRKGSSRKEDMEERETDVKDAEERETDEEYVEKHEMGEEGKEE